MDRNLVIHDLAVAFSSSCISIDSNNCNIEHHKDQLSHMLDMYNFAFEELSKMDNSNFLPLDDEL